MKRQCIMLVISASVFVSCRPIPSPVPDSSSLECPPPSPQTGHMNIRLDIDIPGLYGPEKPFQAVSSPSMALQNAPEADHDGMDAPSDHCLPDTSCIESNTYPDGNSKLFSSIPLSARTSPEYGDNVSSRTSTTNPSTSTLPSTCESCSNAPIAMQSESAAATVN